MLCRSVLFWIERQAYWRIRYDGSTVNRAVELIGKEFRMFIDRKEVGQPGEFAHLENKSADELRAYILQVLGEDANKNETLN